MFENFPKSLTSIISLEHNAIWYHIKTRRENPGVCVLCEHFIHSLISPRSAIVSSYSSLSELCHTILALLEPVRARVFGGPFTARLAEGRGVNEEPQVARKGHPFSPSVVTQSAGRPIRPVNPAVARDFYGVTRFPADITFGIYEASAESDQPRSIGATPLHYGNKRTRKRERGREWEEAGPRGLANRQDSPPKSRSGDITAWWVIHVRASEQLRRCNKLTGSNWLSYNVTSQFAEFSREACGRIYVKQQRSPCYFNSRLTVRWMCIIHITLLESLNLGAKREDYGIFFFLNVGSGVILEVFIYVRMPQSELASFRETRTIAYVERWIEKITTDLFCICIFFILYIFVL